MSKKWAVIALFGLTPCFPANTQEPIDMLDSSERWKFIETTPETISVDEGVLRAKRRSYQSATLVSREDFENFDLQFEFLLHRWCELILLIHAPTNQAWNAGLELVLSDHHGSAPNPHGAGALLGHLAPSAVTVNKNDTWNDCQIHMDWPRLTVTINGQKVQDLDLSTHEDLRYKLRRGKLGFRDLLGWGFETRNMRLTPLPDTENGIPLLNGKDLTGWKEVRPGQASWATNGAILIGDNGNGYLQHERKTQDFDLRLYYRTTPTANGGVFFRWMTDDSDRGNEIQILDVPQARMPSGSIYRMARGRGDAIRPVGEWQFLQLSVRGGHAVTHLNGVKSAETKGLTKIRPGHITLQMHKEKSTIEFKDIVLISRD